MANPKLTFDFPEVSAKFWKQKIQADLKGADYNEKLVWESPEGIKVKPFYSREDLAALDLPATHCPAPWKVGQKVEVKDADAAKDLSLAALEKGAEHLQLEITDPTMVPELLRHLPATASMSFLGLPLDPEALQAIGELAGSGERTLYLNQDPIGHLVASGSWRESREKDLAQLNEILAACEKFPGVHALGVDLVRYHEAGANRVQQLAYGLAHLNEYVEKLQGKLGKTVLVNVAVGSDYFFEIAKLRAFRLLWNTLSKAHGLEDVDLKIQAVPGKRNKTLFDYNTNLLRSSMECMAAVLGNADYVVNHRYDALYHEPNEFADRIARNQLLILRHESHLDKVSNPAAGSYYLESLTQQLATRALELFKQLEQGGGLLAQLKEHHIQRKVADSAKAEQQAFDEGRLVLVGTNAYPNPEDRMKQQLERDPFARKQARKTLIEPLPERRLAAKEEQKRLKDE